jgi:hypothetical protein
VQSAQRLGYIHVKQRIFFWKLFALGASA